MSSPRRQAVRVLFVTGIIAATLSVLHLPPLQSAGGAQPRTSVGGDIYFSPT